MVTERYKCPMCQAYREPDRSGPVARCAACGAWAGGQETRSLSDVLGPPRDALIVQRLDPRATIPTRAHPLDSGLGLYALEAIEVRHDDGRVKVPLGLAVAIPAGYEGQVRPRSGLTLRGLTVHLGTIDAGYRGEVAATIEADRLVRVPYGQAIAQLVVAPVHRCAVVEAAELPEGDTRGQGGFGSTDEKKSTP